MRYFAVKDRAVKAFDYVAFCNTKDRAQAFRDTLISSPVDHDRYGVEEVEIEQVYVFRRQVISLDTVEGGR